MSRRQYFRVGMILETGTTKWIWAMDRTVDETTGSIAYTQVKRDGDQWFGKNEQRMVIGQPDDFAAEKPAMMDNHYGTLVIK